MVDHRYLRPFEGEQWHITWARLHPAAIIVIAVLLVSCEQANRMQLRWSPPLDDKAETTKPQPARSTSIVASAPAETSAWYGIRSVPAEDMQTVADQLGGTVVAIGVGTEGADQINSRLDHVESLGYRAIVVMYTRETCSQRPWEWDGTDWVFPPSAIETLQGIAHHPALFALYALHEPFDTTNACYWTVEQQQKLYQLLKGYTDGAPIWSDVGALAAWEKRGIGLTAGICDYCGTFHHLFRSDWSSDRCVRETLKAINADLDTQQRLMPDSQVVFQIQTFSYNGDGYSLRLPTPEELAAVRDHLRELHQPMLYYPWSHGLYNATLKDAPHLWPIVADRRARLLYVPVIWSSSSSRRW